MTIIKNNEIIGRIVLVGDVNCDGSINFSDSMQVLYLVNNKYGVTAEEDYIKAAMDVNNDGIINKTDSEQISFWDAEYIDEFTRGKYNRGASLIEIQISE